VVYSGQFLKFTFQFGIVGTDEIADTSINYTTVPGWSGAAAALAELGSDVLPGMVGALVTLYGTTGGKWCDFSQLKSIKAAAISTAGAYLSEPQLWEDDSPSQGTFIGGSPQLTTVLSLRSGFTLGGGNRGRMYLPHFSMSGLTASPFTDPGQAQSLADHSVTMINAWTTAINADTTAVLFPAIMSQTGAGSGKGVTEVRVGNVTDTQRRRRAQLNETYFTATLA